MMFPSICSRSLLQPLTSPHVRNRHNKKSDRARRKYDVTHEVLSSFSRPRIQTAPAISPSAFFSPPPPDHADCRCVLLLAQAALRIRQERRLVGVIAPPLVTHKKSIRYRVIERDRIFLQRLSDSAEEPSVIGHIFRARGQREAWCELVLNVRSAAVRV